MKMAVILNSYLSTSQSSKNNEYLQKRTGYLQKRIGYLEINRDENITGYRICLMRRKSLLKGFALSDLIGISYYPFAFNFWRFPLFQYKSNHLLPFFSVYFPENQFLNNLFFIFSVISFAFFGF